MFENRSDLDAVDEFPQRVRNEALCVQTESCIGIYKVPSDFIANRFGVRTSVEAAYVDEIPAVLVKIEGTDDDMISIILDTYALRVAPVLYTGLPSWCDIFPHHF